MAEKRAKSKKHRENLFTLIISVMIAVLSWLVLSITTFSDIRRTLLNVPIDDSLEGTYAALSGLSVVSKDIETVNVSFVGQRDSVGNYGPEDIKVSLNLNSVRTSGTYDVPLVVTSVNGDALEDIEIAPKNTVHIEFDRYASKTLSVDSRTLVFDMDDISAASGYVIDPEEITIAPSEVTISGPQDYIDQVTECMISFDGTLKLNESVNRSTSNIKLLSGEAEFENPRVKIEGSSLFNVYIPVYRTAKLPLNLTIQGYTDHVDCSTVKYTLSDESIVVRSQNADIDKISNISLGIIDIRNIRPGSVFFFSIPLSTYYENISGIDTVQARFDLEGYTERNITLKNSQIHAINTSNDYTITVENDRLNVTVVGPEEILDSLDASAFVAEIDMMEYTISPGQRTFTANIYAPGHTDVWAIGRYQVYATVEATEQVDVPEESEE